MGLMSCTKESITDIYLQTHDTITIYSYAFDTESALHTAIDSEVEFAPYSLYATNDILYIGNRSEKAVYSYDLLQNRYLSKFENNDRTDPLSMITVGNYLFVACGNSREVQIFDRNTAEYVSRLGTGVWTGNVSYATSIAQCADFIYLRDSKTGIRVFSKSDINYAATNNNSYYTSLDCDNLITSNVTSYARDMEVIGDSLYMVDAASGRVYIYATENVKSKVNEYVRRIDFDKATTQGIAYVLAIEMNKKEHEVMLKLKYNNQICFAFYSREKFASLDWENPDRVIKENGGTRFAESGDVVCYGNRHIYTTVNAINFDVVRTDSIMIFQPK